VPVHLWGWRGMWNYPNACRLAGYHGYVCLLWFKIVFNNHFFSWILTQLVIFRIN
jgi:hypothetical protein